MASETTPQQDIEMLFGMMAPNGKIVVQKTQSGRYAGVTAEDSDKLFNCHCSRYFCEERMDEVLTLVSKQGYVLEVLV